METSMLSMLCVAMRGRHSVSSSFICPLQPVPMHPFFYWGWCRIKGRGSPEGLESAPTMLSVWQVGRYPGDFMLLSAYLDIPKANPASQDATLPRLVVEEPGVWPHWISFLLSSHRLLEMMDQNVSPYIMPSLLIQAWWTLEDCYRGRIWLSEDISKLIYTYICIHTYTHPLTCIYISLHTHMPVYLS